MEFKVENLQINENIDIQQVSGHITIYNRSEKKGFVIGKNVYKILSNLNGKNGIKELCALSNEYTEQDILELLETFYNLGFLRIKKVRKKTIKDFWRFKVELIDGNVFFKQDSLLVKVISQFILWGSLPIFMWGIIAMYNKRMQMIWLMNQQVQNIPVVALLIVFWILSAIHEIAHAVVARNFGVPVPDIGLMFYALVPYAYTDLTFISLLEKKREKLCCLLAGIMSNLMIAGIFGIVSAYALNAFCFEIAVLNVLICLTNLMVFFKLDGYFILALLLDENHMRERAIGEVVQGITRFFGSLRGGIHVVKEKQVKGNARENYLFMYIFGALSVLYVPILILSTIITAIQLFT